MPSLIDIRRRIRAVKSTQQITKAMKMVAASKLRRAQERALSARPFAQQMLRVLNRVAVRVPETTHPLLATSIAAAASSVRTLLIVITADKGLCGSFNTNIIKEASRFIVDSAARDVALGLVGRKGRDYFRRHGFDVRYEDVGLFQKIRYTHAQAIARAAIEEFLSGTVSSVRPGDAAAAVEVANNGWVVSGTRTATRLSTRNICCANGRALRARSCARRSFDAATIFMALVICCVDLTARMRRRMSMRDGITSVPTAQFLVQNFGITTKVTEDTKVSHFRISL